MIARDPAGRTALVVGSGIGGLAATIALQRIGITALLYERVSELRKVQVGAGLLIENNAMMALQRLGMAEQVEAAGAIVDRAEHRDPSGRVLATWPIADLSRRLGAPVVAISRSALHRTLAGALDESMVRLNSTANRFEQDRDGVTLHLTDGREERGDFLIGADGINSVIRAQLLGAAKPRYAGYTLWQGTANFTDQAASPAGNMSMVWGRGTKFVSYYVGPQQLFWFVVTNAPEGGSDPEGGKQATVLNVIKGWADPIERVIKATPESSISRRDMYDRDPVKRWGEGRVTLLGDAAHPVTVNAGQGAAQSLEDSVVLSLCLQEHRDVATALRAYEARRMERAGHFQTLSRRLGDLAAYENRLVCGLRDIIIRLTFGGVAWKAHAGDMAKEFWAIPAKNAKHTPTSVASGTSD